MKLRFPSIIALILLMMPIILFAQNTQAPQPFSVSRSSGQQIKLHFQLPDYKLEKVDVNGETLTKVKVDENPYLFFDETETLPVFSTMLAIPYSGGATLGTLDVDQQNSIRLKADFDAELVKERSSGRYSGSLYPLQSVEMSEPQIVRDFRVVSINVYPFQYDQDSGKLVVKSSVDITVNFNNEPSLNEMTAPTALSKGFDSIYRSMIVNYNDYLSRDTVYQNSRMLVIYGNYSDTTYLSKKDEYVAWKKQKGYLVTAVSTATTGTTNTSIKNYIQTQYNNTATRPDYVVLIGDTSGSMAIPSNSTYMDYEYTLLAGGDNLGDVVIGRISVENTDQMVTYMSKLMMLERDIDTSNASWLNRMVLVGDTASSGISTVYTNYYISDVASAVNPSYTYTTQYNSSPSSTTINGAINNGVVFYNYRGYIGMSGWPSSMSSLFNGTKLFHAVFITCNTGSFGGGTSTTEYIVRYGTSATGNGAITAIGMATSSTHTPMNNCLNVGIFHNIFPEGGREMGSAMLCGKLYLYSVYGVGNNATQAYNFSRYCNLIGDPTAAVYIGIPNTFNVTAPTSIPYGTPNVQIAVNNSQGQAVEGASVTLTNASGLQITGFTNQYGYAILTTSTTLTGLLTLTVDKTDFKPAASTITINGSGGIVYDSSVIDDDTATGNGDGIINSGETVNIYVTVKNTTTSSIFLSATATCTDPYVTMIQADRIEYDAIPANSFGENITPVIFSVAQNCPDNHAFYLRMNLEGTSTWSVYVPLVVRSGKLVIQTITYVGATGNILSPGNVFPVTISLQNSGLVNLSGLNGTLRSLDSYLAVQDSLGYYGTVNAGSTVTNSSNTYQVYARATCMDGMVIPMQLYLYNSSGFTQTVDFTITIGQTTVTDPLGQDAYGYFIFDQGDVAYESCPAYSWIPLAPAEGGTGTLLALTDPGSTYDEGDQTGCVSITTVTLPFSFSFYGRSYTQASISSNGFISFGSTLDSDWRNWRLPGPGGPNPMLAVFWDDLQMDSNSGVYTYYNSTGHYYVVQWYNVLSGFDSTSRENFEAILYDPIYYPTQTNDGQIKLQYKMFNNVDTGSGDTYPHGNYCSIGIKDHTGTVGLEYTFNNTYPTAAATLANQTSLFITTRPLLSEFPHLTIQSTNILDANGNTYLEPGETANLSIVLRNSGLTDAVSLNGTLTSSDPYVTITSAYSNYNNIASMANGAPLTNYAINVSASAPLGHQLVFSFTIHGSSQTWVYEIRLNVYTPVLELGNFTILDSSGNGNGTLDPGETVTLRIPLTNSGMVASTSGSATLNCVVTGITINTGQVNFGALAGGNSTLLDFNLTASSAVSIGTLVSCDFTATAGLYTASKNVVIEVGAPTPITIGTGTATQYYPLDRYYNYSAHEAIYLASEIGTAGNIKSLAFYKSSGTDVNPIEAVTIYMKHTTDATLTAGTYSTTGYTQVFSGSFPNTAESGWMEVNLSQLFNYNGVQNLAVLCVKGYQAWISNYPMFTYTSTATNRVRQNQSDTAAPTSLNTSTNLPNIKFKIFPSSGTVYPPQNLAATVSYKKVSLTWAAPVSGTPITYKVYRNSSLLTTLNALSYTDLNVQNNQLYSYYVKAAYSSGDSEASNTVSATPIPLTPLNLSANPSSNLVALTWSAPADGTPTGYNLYRNGSLFSSETGMSFYDVDVTNGTTYTYYVTAVYESTVESAASVSVQATPNTATSITATLGTGTNITTGNQNSPINIINKSVHGQSIYLASELTAAGVTGPINLTQLGFYVVTAPNLALPNFVIRIKHTTATNVTNWETAANLTTVYSNPSYTPTAGGYNLLQLTTPFQWNGVDNLLVDTAFSPVATAGSSGTIQYTIQTAGYHFAWSNTDDQTNVFTGGTLVGRRPNIRFFFTNTAPAANITTNAPQINFGNVEIGSQATHQLTISNTGSGVLAGYFTLPTGYQIAAVRSSDPTFSVNSQSLDRSNLRFVINGIGSLNYQITFTPTAETTYNGNLTVVSNAANTANLNIPLSGTGYLPALDIPAAVITQSGNSVTLHWSAIPRANSYKVYKASSPTGTYTLIGTTAQLQFTDPGSDKGFYYIKAATDTITK